MNNSYEKTMEKDINICAHSYVNFSRSIMEEIKLYKEYKDNGENVEIDVQILKFLDELGFSLDEIGTYYYKDLIVRIIKLLDSGVVTSDDVSESLESTYSQLYFDVARNELDIGIKTFRDYILTAFEHIDIKRANPDLLEVIVDKMNEAISNDQLPLIIALEYKNLIENKPRVRSISVND